MKRKSRKYTLVELLVVVGIMALIMSIALPSFSKMARGQAPKNAARNILATLKGARSYAITERKYVAVIFPDKDNTGVTALKNYAFKRYRACFVKRTDTGTTTTYAFSSWIDGENWKEMPSSAVFSTQTVNTTTGAITGSPSATTVESVVDSSIGLAATNLPGIIFKPTGSTGQTGNTTFTVFEGVVPSPGNDPIATTKSPLNKQIITVNLLGGTFVED